MEMLLQNDGVHPRTLIHWTGRELAGEGYVERLLSIYRHGLWCKPPDSSDRVRCVGGSEFELPRTGVVCFTELGLDNSDLHVEKYGTLGIGFRREYLLKCGANPVFYVQNGEHGIANTNLAILNAVVNNSLITRGIPGGFSAADATGALRSLLSYFKPMSRDDSAEEGAVLDSYNELEWRIAPSPMKASDGSILTPDFFVRTDGLWEFRFDPEEVTLLIVPDAQVKNFVLRDPRLKKFFSNDRPLIRVHGL